MSRAQDDREGLLAEAFVGLADTLVDGHDPADALDRLVRYGVALLAADGAAALLVDPGGRPRVAASSGAEAEWTGLVQVRADEGPCIDCVRTGRPVAVGDLDAAAPRWPRLCAARRERTVPGEGRYRSVHALPLRLRGEVVGGLSLFRTRPGPLPGADLHLGQALADVATIGILQQRAIRRGEVLAGQLQHALDVRVVVEQAKGVLAQLGNIPVDAAFAHLRRYARSHNTLLGDVARHAVADRTFARHILSATVP